MYGTSYIAAACTRREQPHSRQRPSALVSEAPGKEAAPKPQPPEEPPRRRPLYACSNPMLQFHRLRYPFIPKANLDQVCPIPHAKSQRPGALVSEAPGKEAPPKPQPPEEPPGHCLKATNQGCHKMHTITTLTSDDQWIWLVSPRPGAMGAATPRQGCRMSQTRL